MTLLPTFRQRLPQWLLAALLLATAVIGLTAHAAEDQFLEPEKAFRFSVRAADERHVEVLFQIAPDYYMYRERFEVKSPDATLGAVALPPGKVKFDETFQKDVETYRNELRVRVPVQKAPARFALHVVSQGCADAGLCYPPMTSTAQVSLAAFGGDGSARVTAANADAIAGVGSTLGAGSSGAAAAAGTTGERATSWFDGSAVDSVLQSGRFWLVVGAFFVMGVRCRSRPACCRCCRSCRRSSPATAQAGVARRGVEPGGELFARHGAGLYRPRRRGRPGRRGPRRALADAAGCWRCSRCCWSLFALSMFGVYELRLPRVLVQRA